MMGYITCRDEKERIVPFGGPAKKALEQYLGECARSPDAWTGG